MLKNDYMYVKGMKMSESELEDEEEDIWDDSKLNDAYDKALRIANTEVAKRVAMSTNSESKEADGTEPKPETNGTPKRKDKTQWEVGMHCRAVYEEDGIEYEAVLLRLINGTECIVRFLGYENSQVVPISSLKLSLGKTQRTQQIEDAVAENVDDFNKNNAYNVENVQCSDRPSSPGCSVPFQKNKKPEKKKSKQKHMNDGFRIPEIPLPDFSQLRNLGVQEMPLPPPPVGLRGGVDSEEQAISSMLLSWYMSGYYTGLYQGMKRAKEGIRHN